MRLQKNHSGMPPRTSRCRYFGGLMFPSFLLTSDPPMMLIKIEKKKGLLGNVWVAGENKNGAEI